jgi:hypothetical protein
VAWAVSYVASAGYSLQTGEDFWPLVLGTTTPMIVAVVVWAILSGGYRGIGSSSVDKMSP